MSKSSTSELDSSSQFPEKKRPTIKSGFTDHLQVAIESVKQDINHAEEISNRLIANIEEAKGASQNSVWDQTDAEEKTDSLLQPSRFIYSVYEKSLMDEGDEGPAIIGIYTLLKEANKNVRNYCAKHIERDDPDLQGEFTEGYKEDGSIWWEWDNTGDEPHMQLFVRRETIYGPGSLWNGVPSRLNRLSRLC